MPRRLGQYWDPLRDSIGVTVGDVATVGMANVLVEGVSDQITLANASEALRTTGGPSLDLAEISIIPCGEAPVLKEVLSRVKMVSARAVVLVDGDVGGMTLSKVARAHQVPVVHATRNPASLGEASIEDVVGVDQIVEAVNEVYAGVDGVKAITADTIRRCRGTESLARFLEKYFEERYEKAVSKVSECRIGAKVSRESKSRRARTPIADSGTSGGAGCPSVLADLSRCHSSASALSESVLFCPFAVTL